MSMHVERWIRVFAFFEPIIDQYGEDHPEHMDKVREYKNAVMSIFNYDKMGLIGESLGDQILRVAEQGKDPAYRKAHPEIFGQPDLACDDPLYDGNPVF